MKRIILSMAIAIAPVLFANNSFSQAQAKKFTIADTDSNLIASNNDKGTPTVPKLEEAAINNRAIRMFNKDFKNAENVKWYKISDGFVSYCYINGNKSKVFFDEKGRWRGDIVCYTDKTMPKDLRAMVKREYYDYTITQVEQITVQDKTVFQVHLEGEKDWKQLLVADGEITQVTDFKKSLPATNN